MGGISSWVLWRQASLLSIAFKRKNMTPETIITIFQNTLEVILIILLIVLIPALVVGLFVSMIQAATQINEMTLSFIPKLIVTVVTLMMAGPWLLNLVVEYTRGLIQNIPFLIG
jgi:flagellar biosynthetic protein FliQ